MNTDLHDIKSLTFRIDSLLSSDPDLADDMLCLLEELEQIHNYLDKLDVPGNDPTCGYTYTLSGRIEALVEAMGRQIDDLENQLGSAHDLEEFSDEIDEKFITLRNAQKGVWT